MKNVLDWISMVLIFILGILVIIFREDLTTLALIAGIFGIIIGLCNVINKHNNGLLVLIISICLLVSMSLYKNKVLSYSDTLTFMICCSVFFISLFSFVKDIFDTKTILNKYDLTVNGKVIDLLQDKNVSKEVYVPLYEYVVDNVTYNIEDYKSYDKNVPNIGDEIILRVDSKEPGEVYFKKTIFEVIRFKFVTILLMIMCIGILVSLF